MEEQEEIAKSIETAALVEPDMHGSLDLSLFTQKEEELMEELQNQHDQLFRQRATELRFYPDILNEKEKEAIFRCLDYNELIPYYGIVAIQEKNRRLQQMLVTKKVEIRRYCRMTKQSLKVKENEKIDIPDISVADITEKYFSIMKKRGEKTYEQPYYFMNQEHREKMLKIYSKSISKDQIETVPKHPDQGLSVKVNRETEQ